MFRFSKTTLVFALFSASTAAFALDNYKGVGRPANPAEVKAWDIDVRPDFKAEDLVLERDRTARLTVECGDLEFHYCCSPAPAAAGSLDGSLAQGRIAPGTGGNYLHRGVCRCFG